MGSRWASSRAISSWARRLGACRRSSSSTGTPSAAASDLSNDSLGSRLPFSSRESWLGARLDPFAEVGEGEPALAAEVLEALPEREQVDLLRQRQRFFAEYGGHLVRVCEISRHLPGRVTQLTTIGLVQMEKSTFLLSSIWALIFAPAKIWPYF